MRRNPVKSPMSSLPHELSRNPRIRLNNTLYRELHLHSDCSSTWKHWLQHGLTFCESGTKNNYKSSEIKFHIPWTRFLCRGISLMAPQRTALKLLMWNWHLWVKRASFIDLRDWDCASWAGDSYCVFEPKLIQVAAQHLFLQHLEKRLNFGWPELWVGLFGGNLKRRVEHQSAMKGRWGGLCAGWGHPHFSQIKCFNIKSNKNLDIFYLAGNSCVKMSTLKCSTVGRCFENVSI